jgi:membrane-bound lytic murein transglycosylase B
MGRGPAIFKGFIFLIISIIYFTNSLYGEYTTQIMEPEPGGKSLYLRLVDRLSQEGFERSHLESIFSDPRIAFFEEVIDRNLIFRESKANYARFTSPESMALARAFFWEHRGFLQNLERQYGVSKEVIVAILLVESYFGKWPGRYGILSVFSTLSMLLWTDIAEACKRWLKMRYPEIQDDYLERRLELKSKWAYRELINLLRLEGRGGIDILDMKGSWAGAYGLCQFLPSNFLKYGVDGDGDGRIRLDEPYDSMASIANYLRENGWKKGISKKEKVKVLMKYNQSNFYVDTVLKVAYRLKKFGQKGRAIASK